LTYTLNNVGSGTGAVLSLTSANPCASQAGGVCYKVYSDANSFNNLFWDFQETGTGDVLFSDTTTNYAQGCDDTSSGCKAYFGVGQLTGLAAATPATSDNSTKVATTAYVQAQGFGSGNMSGPALATVGDIATFSATTGKTIQDSGTALSALAPLASAALTGTPTAPTASAGDNSQKIATTAYVRSEAQFAWSCPLTGASTVMQNCNWTVPAGLTITGFDLASTTAPVGCTTYAVMQVWDGTAGAEVGGFSMTMSTGTSFYPQVTGSATVAAGHQLRVKVTTAAAGCTTGAAGLVATVTYQMQN